MSNTPKKVGFVVHVENLLSGLTSDSAPDVNSLVVAGTSYSKAQVLAKLKAMLAAYSAVSNARQAFLAASSARKAQQPAASAFVTNLRSVLKQLLAQNPATLASMGIEVKPRAKRSPASNAIAAAKAKATRQARGTLGKKQRAQQEAQASVVVVGADGKPLGSAVSPEASPAPLATPAAVTPAPGK